MAKKRESKMTDILKQAMKKLSEARKIIRASSSRQLAKEWDREATALLADIQETLANSQSAQATQADVTGEREAFESCALMEGSLFKRRADDPDKYWDGNVQDDWELWQARAILALRPQQSGLTGCNCRWDGDTQVQWCELHLAHKDAIHEWAERAKEAEKQLTLRPERVPMTYEQRQSAFLSAPTSSGGHRTAFMLGIQFSEAHHGITAQAKGGE